MTKEALEAQEVSFFKDQKYLLSGINVSFEKGKFNAILGPNGSGKSTLLKILAGIWQPTKGNVSWLGKQLGNMNRKEISRAIALVPQNPQTSFNYLVADVVAMGRYAHDPHYWNSIDTPLINETLQVVDVSHLRNRKINEISYGERQRVYIARALVTGSPVILLDEPTSGLDIRHQIEVMELLKQLIERGKIVVVTIHDLSIAENYGMDVTLLKQGKCLGAGPFAELMTDEAIDNLFDLRGNRLLGTQKLK